jgi:TPR repeat protein
MDEEDLTLEEEFGGGNGRIYSFPEKIEKMGIVAGLLPFVVHLTIYDQRTINGEIVEYSHMDIAALIGAVLAFIAGFWAFTKIKETEKVFRMRRTALAVTLFLLAFVQGLSGFGKLNVDETSDESSCRKKNPTACEALCAQNELWACVALGELHFFGQGVPVDKARSFQLMQKSCTGGESTGCYNLGVMYRDGISVEKDTERAVQLFEQACDTGAMGGCTNLGVLVEKKDPVRSIALYRKSYDNRYIAGCRNLGAMYLHGLGVAIDVKRAATLFKQACDGDFFMACNDLGLLVDEGRGVVKDGARAAGLFKKACDGGVQTACAALKNR